MSTPKNKAQIFRNPYVVHCDMFNCRNRAEWFCGRPDGPLNLCMNLCDECLKSILRLLPVDLQEHVPRPEGTVLVSADYLDELEQKVLLMAESEPDQNEPEKFTCPECGREFGTQQALIAHSRVHKGAK